MWAMWFGFSVIVLLCACVGAFVLFRRVLRHLRMSPRERMLARRVHALSLQERELQVERRAAEIDARSLALQQARAAIEARRDAFDHEEFEAILRALDGSSGAASDVQKTEQRRGGVRLATTKEGR